MIASSTWETGWSDPPRSYAIAADAGEGRTGVARGECAQRRHQARAECIARRLAGDQEDQRRPSPVIRSRGSIVATRNRPAASAQAIGAAGRSPSRMTRPASIAIPRRPAPLRRLAPFPVRWSAGRARRSCSGSGFHEHAAGPAPQGIHRCSRASVPSTASTASTRPCCTTTAWPISRAPSARRPRCRARCRRGAWRRGVAAVEWPSSDQSDLRSSRRPRRRGTPPFQRLDDRAQQAVVAEGGLAHLGEELSGLAVGAQVRTSDGRSMVPAMTSSRTPARSS